MKAVDTAEPDWFRTTLHCMEDCVVATDGQGRILHMNPAAERLCGLRECEVRGKSVEEVVRFAGEAAGAGRVHPVVEAMERGASVGLGERSLSVDGAGAERPISGSAEPIRDSDGNVAGIVLVMRDRAEKGPAERLLQESEGRYRKLFDEAGEGIALTDAKAGTFVDCNRAFLRLVGYRKADLVGRRREIVFPEGEEPPATAYGMGGKRGELVDAKVRTKAGVTKDVEIKESLMELGGRIVVQSFFRDVSDARRTLRERETTLELLRMLNEGCDPTDLIEAVTRFLHGWTGCEAVAVRLKEGDDYPYYRTSGFPPEFVQLESRLCAELPDGRVATDEAGDPVLECLCGNVICGRFDAAKPFYTEKGSFWANDAGKLPPDAAEEEGGYRTRGRCSREGYESVALIRLRHGARSLGLLQINDRAQGRFTPELIAFLEQLADLIAAALAQKLGAKALSDSESRLRLSVSATQVGFFDWECKTDRVHYSPEWKLQLGYLDGEIPDEFREWRDRLHPDEAEAVSAQVNAYLASPWPNYRNEFRLRHKDGSYRWILAQASVTLGADGAPEHMVGCHIDITDRKKVEQEVRDLNAGLEERVHQRTLALEAANGELQAFAYSISHDLRAPLRGIDGLASILAEDHGEALGTEGKALCSRINENTRRMGQLIDDLLTYSRLGRADVHRCDVDMCAMVESVFGELGAEVDTDRVRISVGALPVVHGDPALIRQVWVNLIGNALKFSSKREQAAIEVGGTTSAGEHVFYVRDNGAGFDMQYADKLFGVFQRLHGAGEFDGTGVGLAIVQRVVRRHGGRAWAVGEVDHGATVYFALPEKV